MSIRDVAGVLSRFFIVGCFLPSFFALIAIVEIAGTVYWLPFQYTEASAGARILILGGLAVLLGQLLATTQAAAAQRLSGQLLPRSVQVYLVARQHRRFDRLQSAVRSSEPKRATRDVASAFGATAGSDADDEVQQPPSIPDSCIQRPPPESDTRPAKSSIDVDGIGAGIALETLTREFPNNPDDIGPTGLANARRAHSARMNFGLDEAAVLPLIEALATTDQRAMLEDARTELAFLINAVLWAVVIVLVAIVRVVSGGPQQWWQAVLAAVAAWILYRIAVGSAFRMNNVVAPLVALHRLALYKQLGLGAPRTEADERDLARAVNRMILVGEPVPTKFRAVSEDDRDGS